MKPYTSIDLAYWFLNKSAGDGETWREMTQMKLQKLVYFSQLVAVMSNGKPIHDDITMAWRYGPVAPALYRVLKQFKGNPLNIARNDALKKAFEDWSPISIEDEKSLEIIGAVWEKFKDWSAGKMMQLAYTRGCAWDHAYLRKPNSEIEQREMRAFGFGYG